MGRILLESVGMSISLALLWFVYLPVFLGKQRGDKIDLVWNSLAVFIVALIGNFCIIVVDMAVIDPVYLFAYHALSFSLGAFTVYVLTSTAKRSPNARFLNEVRPLFFILIIFIIVSSLSHGFRSIELYGTLLYHGWQKQVLTIIAF